MNSILAIVITICILVVQNYEYRKPILIYLEFSLLSYATLYIHRIYHQLSP